MAAKQYNDIKSNITVDCYSMTAFDGLNKDIRSDYDMVIGGVANDKVFNTVELFFDGLIDKTEAIGRLRYEKPNLQIAFRTDKALTYLHFEGSEQL